MDAPYRGPTKWISGSPRGGVAAYAANTAGHPKQSTEDPTIEWADVLTEKVIKKVAIWAGALMRQRVWRGAHGASPPGCPSPEDLVHTALVKTIEGSRRWNRSACSIEKHLIEVVRSDLFHLGRSPENRRSRFSDVTPADEHPKNASLDPKEHSHTAWPRILEQELPIEQTELKHVIDKSFPNDMMASRVAHAMLEFGDGSSKFLSQHLDIPVSEAHTVLRRVRRKLRPLLKYEES